MQLAHFVSLPTFPYIHFLTYERYKRDKEEGWVFLREKYPNFLLYPLLYLSYLMLEGAKVTIIDTVPKRVVSIIWVEAEANGPSHDLITYVALSVAVSFPKFPCE